MSAYFITEDGVSRPIQVGLDEAAVLAAPEGPDRYMTSKLVGGSLWGTLGAWAGHARNAFGNAASKIQEHLPAALGIAGKAAHAFATRDPMAGLGAAQDAYGLGRKLAGYGYSGAGMYPSDVSDVGMDYGQQNAGTKRGRLSDRL